MKTLRTILLAILIIPNALSQNLQDSVRQDEKEIVSAIAAYPSDVRNAILDISQYTPKLIKLERLQARTSQSFQDLVANKSREEQEKFYEISRYPELIKELGGTSIKSEDELKTLLASYPEVTQKMIREIYPSQAREFRMMNSLLEKSDESMQQIIKSLPAETQSNFNKIVVQPDVMNLLTDRIDNVVSLGEAYKENPEEVKKNLDDLSAKLTEQSEKDLVDYKKKVESDPQMQEEMKKSAEQFSDSYSASSEANANDDEEPTTDANQPTQQPVVNNYDVSPNYLNTNPYPYWFGSPFWYANPIWYPRPWYYHTGFYLGASGNLMVVGMPSGYYSRWFFRYGWNAYPRYYGFCRNYYNAHHTFVSRNVNVYRGFNRIVNNHFTRVNKLRNVNNRNVVNNRLANSHRTQITRNNRTHINNNHFNHPHYNNFRAQQFHQHNWGGTKSGGFRSGGRGGRRK